jgi:hypothetical protein
MTSNHELKIKILTKKYRLKIAAHKLPILSLHWQWRSDFKPSNLGLGADCSSLLQLLLVKLYNRLNPSNDLLHFTLVSITQISTTSVVLPKRS